MNLGEMALKYAIKNAYEHFGKPNTAAVIGKLKALFPEENMQKIVEAAKDTVIKVETMEPVEIENKFKEYEKAGFELKPKAENKELSELDWAKNEEVITRFAPNPNAPFHLGNARAAILSAIYAKKYSGKFLLRFDDTDPKLKIPIENAQAIFLEDLAWLSITPDQIIFASDRLNMYYEHMEKLVEMGKGYVCTCEVEIWRKKIQKNEACECREKDPEYQMEMLKKMKNHELKEGSAVLRIKTDLRHKDPSVRDWFVARIVDNPTHPRVDKDWHIWPSYNFASALDDHDLRVTFIIRGQEHEQNKTKQEFLYNYFGWKYPHISHIGRVKLEGSILSKSKITKGVEEGEYTGFDDPRLGTIKAFRRRGFKAQALTESILEIGLKPNDTTIQWKNIASKNKKLIENSPKIPFIAEPVEIRVNFCPEKVLNIEGKPIILKKGTQSFIADKKKVEGFGNKVFRLREAYNIRVTKIDQFFAEADYVGDTKIKNTLCWLTSEETLQILMPNGKTIQGSTEQKIDKYIGKEVHLEGFGYAFIESEGKAIFTHE